MAALTVGADIDLDAPSDVTLRAAIHRAAQLPATHPTQLRAIGAILTNLRRPDGSPRLGRQVWTKASSVRRSSR